MTPERHHQIGELYHAALDLSADQRAGFLEDACRGDTELRQEVESLLAAHERAAGFISTPAAFAVPRSPDRLPAGSAIGCYRVLTLAGAGGMGEVYLAEDARLGRRVALKLLPPGSGGDTENARRFEHEARAASALNHPNIVTVHDVGVSDARRYIVMEFVDGRTLRDILSEGSAPDRVVRLGSQIARALAVAHAAGIVHRDVKPENVMVRGDGYVKLLDFGLAGLPQRGETLSAADALPGRLLGTARYLSPEQARGAQPTAASDIFSLGIVFYELSTGEHPFAAESLSAALHAVVTQSASPPSKRNPAIEPWLDGLILRMLEKDPRNRPAAADVEAALSNHGEKSAARPAQSFSGTRRWWGIGVAASLLTAGLTTALHFRSAPDASAGPRLTRLTWDIGLTAFPSISLDGRLLAFASDRADAGNLDIWVQPAGGGEPKRRTFSPGDDDEPCVSPDGREIAYRSVRGGRSSIYVMPALSGEERLLVPNGSRPKFSPDGKWIAYSTDEAHVYLIATAGGAPIAFQPQFMRASYPIWLNAEFLLFLGGPEGYLPPHLDWWVASIHGNKPVKTGVFELLSKKHRLSSHGGFWFAPGTWSEKDNVVVFTAEQASHGSNLWQVPLARDTWKPSGAPRQITKLTLGFTAELQPSMARDGRMVFANIENDVNVWMLPVDTNAGKVTGEMKRITHDASRAMWHDISPDGNTLVFNRERVAGNWEIWMKDLLSSRETPLVVTDSPVIWPKLSKDGKKLAYTVQKEDGKWEIHVLTLGEARAELVCQDCTQTWEWSPDGSYLIYLFGEPRQIGAIDLTEHRKSPILVGPDRLQWAKVSPDGRWIAFGLTTPFQAYRLMLAPFRGVEKIAAEDWIALTDDSSFERPVGWSSDGRLLYSFSGAHGYRCLFAHRLDPATGRRLELPIEVAPLHRRYGLFEYSPAGDRGSAIARGKCVFSLGVSTGNLWMTQLGNVP